MKNLLIKNLTKVLVSVIFITLLSTALLYAFSTGIDGRTLKTTTTGCTCHSSSLSPTVIVFISGPDSVLVNQTVNYTIEISEPSKSGAGLDIATKSGTLGVVTPGLHLSNGELVHSSNLVMTNHAVVVTFSYTAPGFVTADTIWATGLATNSNGQVNGDIWNWAPSKRINVKSSIGITPISSNVPSNYNLSQNYPNPFNPVTKINFEIPKQGFVTLRIFDLLGREVKTLVNETATAGSYSVDFNATEFSSGVYFYKLTVNDFVDTKRMTLIK